MQYGNVAVFDNAKMTDITNPKDVYPTGYTPHIESLLRIIYIMLNYILGGLAGLLI